MSARSRVSRRRRPLRVGAEHNLQRLSSPALEHSVISAELETLPGVGPVTAAAILQWRADHGAFSAVEELLEVSGIGDATLAEIAPFVTL